MAYLPWRWKMCVDKTGNGNPVKDGTIKCFMSGNTCEKLEKWDKSLSKGKIFVIMPFKRNYFDHCRAS